MQDYVNINVTCLLVCLCVCLRMEVGALAHWLQGQPMRGLLILMAKMLLSERYRAQITNLSMRPDTTLQPTPKTNPQINIKSTQTDSTHTGQTQLHRTPTSLYNTYLHRHPKILSELPWHPSICVMWLLLVLK